MEKELPAINAQSGLGGGRNRSRSRAPVGRNLSRGRTGFRDRSVMGGSNIDAGPSSVAAIQNVTSNVAGSVLEGSNGSIAGAGRIPTRSLNVDFAGSVIGGTVSAGSVIETHGLADRNSIGVAGAGSVYGGTVSAGSVTETHGLADRNLTGVAGSGSVFVGSHVVNADAVRSSTRLTSGVASSALGGPHGAGAARNSARRLNGDNAGSLCGGSGIVGVDNAAIRPDFPPAATNRPPLLQQQSGNQPTAPRSWANVARAAAQGYSLTYYPLNSAANNVVDCSEEDLDAADPLWKECLVGYFVGKKLPFKLVETALKHLWGHRLFEVKANDQGFYFFHIPDSEFRRKIIEGGPLTVARVPLILQQWHPMLELKKEEHSSVPVWIRLKNLPYGLWSSQGLSKVASAVGKPLYVDQRTEQLKMISFARVCVELNASKPCCDSINVLLNGATRVVEVEYEWKPTSCQTCGVFGHRCPASNPCPAQFMQATQP
ncbi:hypothetical protein BT93_L4620 [Corymbia citriodora subsp. variegata]|uniref:DUF4283 domain-containing protein n=1 Tax=Corymbia citriodora subsp. variegata TaxID=360336 RepID=A0A8T0CXK2_CORYI|nr:hypothetical protein BT93_L4620 [Corymbia citriodora subsp. variegata]